MSLFIDTQERLGLGGADESRVVEKTSPSLKSKIKWKKE